MKRFEIFEFDKETERLDEARPMRPDRLTSGNLNVNMQAFIDNLKSKQTLPIGVYGQEFQRNYAREKIAKKNAKAGITTTDRPGPLSKRKTQAATRTVVDLKVQNSAQIIREVEKAMAEMDPAVGSGKDRKKANLILGKIRVKTPGRTYSFFDIDHTSYSKKTGEGGQSSAHINQALQCITSACMANGIMPLVRNYEKISKYVEIGNLNVQGVIRSREDRRYMKDQGRKDDWISSSVSSHKALEKEFGSLKGYVFVNENDSIAEMIGNHAISLASQVDPIWSGHLTDRWCPADIWILKNRSVVGKLLNTKDITEMNNLMLKMYINKDLIGVSMKKPGSSASIKKRNTEVQEIVPEFNMKPVRTLSADAYFGKQGGFEYVAKDGGARVKMACYNSTPVGCVIATTPGARSGGQIGGSTTSTVVEKYFNLPDKSSMWGEFSTGYPKAANSTFWYDFAAMYTRLGGRKMFASELREAAYVHSPPEKISKMSAVFHTWNNLYMMYELAELSTSKRQECLQKMYMWCTSMTPQSAVHIVVGKDTSVTASADNSKKKDKKNPGVSDAPSGGTEEVKVSAAERESVRQEYPEEEIVTSSVEPKSRVRKEVEIPDELGPEISDGRSQERAKKMLVGIIKRQQLDLSSLSSGTLKGLVYDLVDRGINKSTAKRLLRSALRNTDQTVKESYLSFLDFIS